MAAPAPGYPFVPKSNAYLRAGQFWAVPLSDGRFGCGRVLDVPKSGDLHVPANSRMFLAGLLDWVGSRAAHRRIDRRRFADRAGLRPYQDDPDDRGRGPRLARPGGRRDRPAPLAVPRRRRHGLGVRGRAPCPSGDIHGLRSADDEHVGLFGDHGGRRAATRPSFGRASGLSPRLGPAGSSPVTHLARTRRAQAPFRGLG